MRVTSLSGAWSLVQRSCWRLAVAHQQQQSLHTALTHSCPSEEHSRTALLCNITWKCVAPAAVWPGALLVPLPSAAALSGEHIKSAPHCVCDAAAAALAVLSLSLPPRSLTPLLLNYASRADIVPRASTPKVRPPPNAKNAAGKLVQIVRGLAALRRGPRWWRARGQWCCGARARSLAKGENKLPLGAQRISAGWINLRGTELSRV